MCASVTTLSRRRLEVGLVYLAGPLALPALNPERLVPSRRLGRLFRARQAGTSQS